MSLLLGSAVVLAVLLGALAQSVSGIGFSLVCGPLLVLVLGAPDAVRLGVLLSIGLNLVLVTRYRGDVDVRGALTLLVPTVLSLPLFAVLLRSVPERAAAGAAGSAVLLGAVLLGAGVRWHRASGRTGAVGAGLVAAAATVAASVPGPPVALWAANAGWSPSVQRATLQLFFLGTNLVAVAALGVPDVPGPVLGLSTGALVAGILLGVPVARRVSERGAARATLLLAGLGGLVVLLRAVAG